MASSLTNALAIGATVLGGLVAGPAVNRVFVEMPAWREVGSAGWASYTRAADLGPGLVLYPALGVGAMLLAIATAAAFRFDRLAPRAAAFPVYAAPLLAIAAFTVTRWAMAPQILALRHGAGDPASLGPLLVEVTRWWTVKGALHVATFGASVWALVALLGREAA